MEGTLLSIVGFHDKAEYPDETLDIPGNEFYPEKI